DHTRYLKLMVYAIILPFIANSTGWIMTEMGRQPFVVFGLMKTEDAISPSVTANEMLFSLISFTTMYSILAAITIYLFIKQIKKVDFDEKDDSVITNPFAGDNTEDRGVKNVT